MKFGIATLILSVATTFSTSAVAVSINALNVALTENFDTLASSGTSSTLPSGWSLSESGTSANSTYTAGTGSSTTGDTYSFGATGSSERAFGGLQSGSLIPTIGVQFANDTGSVINALLVAYTGEQWRLGALARIDRLDFQYSLDATSLSTGTWSDVDGLDFTAPVEAGTVGALNGNSAVNRTALSTTIGSLAIPAGSTIWFRWTDLNASGSDDGLAIDDFSLIPMSTQQQQVPESLPLSVSVIAFAGILGLSRWFPRSSFN